LVIVEDTDRPFLTRSLRVPDRVTMHLLGDDAPDAGISSLIAATHTCGSGDPVALSRGLAAGATFVYVRESTVSAGRALAAEAFRLRGWPTLAIDFRRLEQTDAATLVAEVALREARLRGAGLVAGPIE